MPSRRIKYGKTLLRNYLEDKPREPQTHFTLFNGTREIVTSTNRAELIRLANELIADDGLTVWAMELPNRGYGFYQSERSEQHPVYIIKVKCK